MKDRSFKMIFRMHNRYITCKQICKKVRIYDAYEQG